MDMYTLLQVVMGRREKEREREREILRTSTLYLLIGYPLLVLLLRLWYQKLWTAVSLMGISNITLCIYFLNAFTLTYSACVK